MKTNHELNVAAAKAMGWIQVGTYKEATGSQFSIEVAKNAWRHGEPYVRRGGTSSAIDARSGTGTNWSPTTDLNQAWELWCHCIDSNVNTMETFAIILKSGIIDNEGEWNEPSNVARYLTEGCLLRVERK